MPPLSIRPLTILLAEDDANLRSMLSIVLRRDGHRVVEFRDGVDLKAALSDRFALPGPHFDDILVVADWRMPGLDGLGALETTRALSPAVPFILITAFADPKIRAAAEARGALSVLSKPFDFDELRTTIRVYLSLRAQS